MDLLTASTFFPLWSWKLNTGGAWEEQTTESGQFDMVFQPSIAQRPCRNLRAGQKDLLLWPCATFLTFLYALNYFLTHKSESSELVLQSHLWSSIRKSYVRSSGLGASYPAAFLNYLPHFSRTQMRKYHQNEGGKSQNCSDEEARQGEHELNRRWAQLCAKEERCLKIMGIWGDNAQANRCKLFLTGLFKEQGIVQGCLETLPALSCMTKLFLWLWFERVGDVRQVRLQGSRGFGCHSYCSQE